MSELMGNLANFFSGPTGKGILTAAQLGTTGAGLVGNILTEKQRSNALKAEQNYLNMTPQQLAAEAASAVRPLDASLTRAISQRVNANLAEQGLSQSPGLIASDLAESLAPYQQQNMNQALQLLYQRMGFPEQFIRSLPPTTNLSQSLAALMQSLTKLQPNNYPVVSVPSPDVSTTGTYDYSGLIPPSGG